MKANVKFFRERRKLESRRLLSNYREWLEAGALQAGVWEVCFGRVMFSPSSKLSFKQIIWPLPKTARLEHVFQPPSRLLTRQVAALRPHQGSVAVVGAAGKNEGCDRQSQEAVPLTHTLFFLLHQFQNWDPRMAEADDRKNFRLEHEGDDETVGHDDLTLVLCLALPSGRR